MLFRYAICGSVPETFAIKVESCQKSRRILDVFSPSKILGGRPSKSYTHFITATSRHVAWKKFCEDTVISPEVLVAHTLNVKSNFKFSRLNFFFGGGPPSQFWCALARLGQSAARVKIWGGSTPQRPKCSRQKNVRLGVSIWATKTFLFEGQSSPIFFTQRGRGCSWYSTLRICDVWIRSGDIRDQSRKLSEIAQNFGRFFFALPNFRGPAFQK